MMIIRAEFNKGLMVGITYVKIQLVGIEGIPILISFGLKNCDSTLNLFVNVVFTIKLFSDIKQVGTT